MEQHLLLEQACDMGFDRDLAVAALVSFADSKAGASVRQLTVQKYGEEFVDFLFAFDRPAQQKQPQQPLKQPNKHASHHQKPQQQRRNSRQQPQRGCKRRRPDLDSVDAEDSDSQGNSGFIIDDSKQQQDEDGWDASLHAQQQKQQEQLQEKQQPRQRLRRSCEAAQAAPAAEGVGAAEDPNGDPAVQIARHRRRVLQDSSSEDDGGLAAGAHQYSAAIAAAAAADGSGQHTASRGAASVRNQYQHAATDLDFMITQVTTAPAAAAAAGRGSARRTPAMLPQQQQQQQHPMRSQGKQTPAQAQTKQKKAAGGADPHQPKLERFFSTPAQQQVSTGAAGSGGGTAVTGVDRSGPSPLTFSRVTNSSMRPSDKSFASRMAAGEGGVGPSAARTPAGGYKTPAQALRGPANLAHAALAAAGYGGAGRTGGAAAGQYHHGYGPAAAAAGGPVAPWYQPLAKDEAALDHFDLVNLKVFGHSSFRPSQKEIVQQAVQGRDLFVLMPTGGGKSLCYQLPAVMRPGVTVVVCPLLSLMQDQVRALCQNLNGGIPASFLSSQQSEAEAVAVKKELTKLSPTVKLLYVTPEQLVKSNALRRILHRLEQNGKLARFVIDEAHCVSTWGHDFRPDYKGLRVLRAEFKHTPITAVTATATREVQADILSTLGITRTVTVHQTSFLRPNLLLKVVPKVREEDENTGMPIYITKLIGYIKRQTAIAEAKAAEAAEAAAIKQEHNQQRGKGSSPKVNCSGIVYCMSRKEAEGVAQVLQEQGGIKAAHYHAGMTPKQRTEVQNAFFSGTLQVIVATIAFGMGIDKPDVRFVVHFCMSKSLEGYYQEAGRAGRDGQPAECVLMYSNADINRHMFILRKSMGGSKSTDRFKKAVDQLDTMKEYAMAGKVCRHAQLLEYFGVVQTDLPERRCTHSCDVCRGEVVPLNPEDWAAPDDGDGLCAEELEGPIDLLEEDSEDIEQQQQQRSGGRRRPSLYNGEDGEWGGDGSEGIEILDSGSEGGSDGSSSEGSGSEGSKGSEGGSGDEGGSGSSEGWSDDEGQPRAAAAAGAAAAGGVADRRSGGSGRPHAQARHPQQQQQQRRQQSNRAQPQHQQRQQQQQQSAAPVFQGFQRAPQLQTQEEPDQEQQQQHVANGFQQLSGVLAQRQQQRQRFNHSPAHNPHQQRVGGAQLGQAPHANQQQLADGFEGFQCASALQQQQQHVQEVPEQGKQQQQQQQQPGAGQAGLGLGSSRFNRVMGGGVSRIKTSQQQQQQGKPVGAAAGFVSAATLQGTGRGSGSAAAVAAAGVAQSKPVFVKTAVGLVAAEDVPWIEKKSSGSSGGKRLGMCGGGGGGSSGLSRGLGGAVRGSRASPADALAAELQAADACDMF